MAEKSWSGSDSNEAAVCNDDKSILFTTFWLDLVVWLHSIAISSVCIYPCLNGLVCLNTSVRLKELKKAKGII